MAERTLPENAHRELKPGEVYTPVIGPNEHVPEVTARSITFGLIMTVIFSGAASYIALKLGQGIETAIPISILAIGWSAMMRRKSTLIENVNILSIGATSGIVVGGSVFVMPAIFILNLQGQSSFFQIFLVPLLGAILGVLFLIPFRRYFVAEMHGQLPFPEATATTEVLMTGERGGKQAVVLLYSMGIAMVTDFVGPAMNAWREVFTTRLIPGLSFLTDKVKMVFSLDTTAAVMGLGYLIGVRYSLIIMAGSLMSYFVLVPVVAHFGAFIPPNMVVGGHKGLAAMSADQIFDNYVRYIGIGGIFAAGLISILKMSGVIRDAMKNVVDEIFHRPKDTGEKGVRTERDMSMGIIMGVLVALTILLWIYFRYSVLARAAHPTFLSSISIIVTLFVAFLFTGVSAWAVAMISVTPVSGMTLTTLIVSAVLLTALGLTGTSGMIAVLLIGGVVCTALSMAGSLVTQFKIGYWLGSTPSTIQISNILASVVAAVVVTAVMFLLDSVYGFSLTKAHPHPMAAPQANAMAAVVQGMMGGKGTPWLMYGVGAVVAVMAEMLGVSGLAFALGMYLPIELNSPILAGAFVAWLVNRSTKDEALRKARHDKGTLIASGLIAGGAIIGVVAALLKFMEAQFHVHIIPNLHNNTTLFGNYLGLVIFILLGAFLYWDSVRTKAGNGR